MSQTSHAPTDARPLTVDEIALYYSVPKSTVYYWISIGAVPYVKAGRHPLFYLEDVKEHFKKKTEENKSCLEPLQKLSVSRPSRSLKIRNLSRVTSAKSQEE